MNFVLDASVALAWCFEDEGGAYAIDVLNTLQTAAAVATSLWPLEVTNGLVTAQRRGRIDAGAAARYAQLLLSLPIVVDPVARRRAFDVVLPLARKHALTSYDAAYLELAMRLGVPLATLDAPLRQAAEAEGIAVFVPA
jgi:predicted nucleic acid-binding protein